MARVTNKELLERIENLKQRVEDIAAERNKAIRARDEAQEETRQANYRGDSYLERLREIRASVQAICRAKFGSEGDLSRGTMPPYQDMAGGPIGPGHVIERDVYLPGVEGRELYNILRHIHHIAD